jgi:hypothetical protein
VTAKADSYSIAMESPPPSLTPVPCVGFLGGNAAYRKDTISDHNCSVSQSSKWTVPSRDILRYLRELLPGHSCLAAVTRRRSNGVRRLRLCLPCAPPAPILFHRLCNAQLLAAAFTSDD